MLFPLESAFEETDLKFTLLALSKLAVFDRKDEEYIFLDADPLLFKKFCLYFFLFYLTYSSYL